MMMKIFLEQALLLLNTHIRSRVISFKPIDRRLWVLRIRGEFKNYSFISAHVPTEEKSEKQKQDVQAVPLIQYKNYVWFYKC
jgi:hypothetical protein